MRRQTINSQLPAAGLVDTSNRTDSQALGERAGLMSKGGGAERSLYEELDRIDTRLKEIGLLLQELLNGGRGVNREWYSTQEVARILGKRPFTVREWCRLGRVRAERALSGRGVDKEWRISHQELVRIQNEGLLPLPQRY